MERYLAIVNPTAGAGRCGRLAGGALQRLREGGLELDVVETVMPVDATRIAREAYGQGRRRAYKHHDLGFVVDLGGLDAAANPLGIPLSGFPAKVVTRGYHLLSMPGNRVRVAADWLLDAVLPRQDVQLGLVPGSAVPLDSIATAERR